MNPLTKVRRAALKVEVARAGLYVALLAAREEGKTLREIAEASGLNHETVRKLTTKAEWPPVIRP